MSRYNHYLVEITEPTSSNEVLRVRVMLENGYSVYFGEIAELLVDILKGNCPMMTDDAIRAALREKDEKIKVMQEQIKELTDVRDYLRNENIRLTGETTKFSNMIQERNKEIDILSRQFTNHTNTIIDQNNAINALKKKNAELIKTNKALEDESAEYCRRPTEKNDENCLLVGEVDHYKSKIEAMEKTHEKGLNAEWLREELNTYCEENEKLRKKNDDLADRNFDLAEELEEKEAEIKRLYEAGYGDKRLFDLMNEIMKLEMKNKEIKGMYNTQCEVVKDQQKQLKGSHEYMHKLEKRIDEQKTTIDILEKSYAEAMGEKDKEINKLKNDNEVLTNELYNELSERNCIATYKLTISRLERRNKELEGIILKREERIGELMQHKEWLERNSFHGIAVCNGSIGEKVKYAVDNMKLEHENQKLRNKNNLLQAQNTRFRDACINAGLRLKELHTYLTSLDEE